MIIIGDVHGEWGTLRAALIGFDVADTSLIQVGDFGLGFAPLAQEIRALVPLSQELARRDTRLFFLRGNHDDPRRCEKVGAMFAPYITYLPDYSRLTVGGQRVLVVGGAISVDRHLRTLGLDYWQDEGFVWRPALCDAGPTDLLITHTAPPAWVPGLSPMVWADPSLGEDLETEAEGVRLLVQQVRPALHVFGHYHHRSTFRLGECQHRCLGIHEWWDVYPVSE